MSLMEWNPFRDMEREMESMFERFPFRAGGQFRGPRVDIYQTENDVVVKAEIPGVAKDDLNVFVDDNSIRLSGQTRRDNQYKDENVYRTERFYGNFSRTIPLPANVKSEEARAEYHDGILSITIPRTQPSRTRGRKLDIH
ncbi:MAG: Hsp20/alpha crystallin family protein [Bacillota bacterium]